MEDLCQTLGLCYIHFFGCQIHIGFCPIVKVDDCDGLMRSCECPAADLVNFGGTTGTDHPCASSDLPVRNFPVSQKVANTQSKTGSKTI